MDFKAPISIYIIYHQNYKDGEVYKKYIYSSFMRPENQPLIRKVGIQVFGITSKIGNDIPVINFDWNNKTHFIFAVLIEENIVLDEKWQKFLSNISKNVQNSNGKHLVIPILSNGKLPNPSGIISSIQQIRLSDVDNDIKQEYLIIRLAQVIYRFIRNKFHQDNPGSKLKLFLSHAKKDGNNFTKNLQEFISNKLDFDVFFDALSIETGYNFDDQIKEAVETSTILVLQTDAYSSRPWCRKEILFAKKNHCPIIVINDLLEGESRSFPYMCNVPVLRINNISNNLLYATICKSAILEFLRFAYQKELLTYLNIKYDAKFEDEAIFPFPPELLTVLPIKENSINKILYSDPLLGDEELDLLNTLDKHLTFLTPQMLPLYNKLINGEKRPLNNIRVGISISGSNEQYNKYYTDLHLQDIMVDISRYLLASGASLVYGGSLHNINRINFTELFFDLLKMHNSEDPAINGKIFNFTIFPYSKFISKTMQAELINVAKVIEIPIPDDLIIDQEEFRSYVNANDPEKREITARLLTLMREKMNEMTSARIFIGGRIEGFDGKFPGVFEEVYLALKSNQPVYLLGAFGGCTSLIVNILHGLDVEDFAKEFAAEGSITYDEIIKNYHKFKLKNAKEVEFLSSQGINILNNGLSNDDNVELMKTNDQTLIIQLILKGLLNKFTYDT